MNRRYCFGVPACIATLIVGGCGGGGGDSKSPSASVDHSTVAVSAMVTDASASPYTVRMTFANAGAGVYVGFGSTKNGISSVGPGAYSATYADFDIAFKAPYTLKPGTYNDTVELEACLDANCAQQIAGSPITVKVTYTVNPPTAGSEPSISATTNAIALQVLPSAAAPGAGFGIHIVNPPTFPMTARVTATSNAVLTAAIDLPDWNSPPQQGFPVSITLKSPADLTPGVHTDQVKVEICLDPACVNPLAGSPQTVTVTYQVGNDVPGSYTVKQISLQAADLAADDLRGLLYAAVPAAAPTNASSVAIIDPVQARVSSYVPVGFDPGKLAISDDGGYLYVGELNGPHIARFVLPAMTLDATIALANDPHGQATYPKDIKVLPGAPKTIAVGRNWPQDISVQGAGIVIYDDTTARPQVGALDGSGNPQIYHGYVAWGGTAGTLYTSGQGSLGVLSVDGSGAQLTATASNPGNVRRIQYTGGLLYADSGSIFDAGSLASVGSLPNPNQYDGAVTVDGTAHRIYQTLSNGGGLGTYLNLYDAGTIAPHGTADIQGVYLQYLVGSSLTRWGTNGLAFLATDQQAVSNAPVNQVVLISGPFVVQ